MHGYQGLEENRGRADTSEKTRLGKALFCGQFTEPERTAFTRDLSKNWISQGPGLWHAALADLLSPLVEQDFTKWKRLAVLSNSDQHVQHVCKVAEQPRGKWKAKQWKKSVWVTRRQMWLVLCEARISKEKMGCGFLWSPNMENKDNRHSECLNKGISIVFRVIMRGWLRALCDCSLHRMYKGFVKNR